MYGVYNIPSAISLTMLISQANSAFFIVMAIVLALFFLFVLFSFVSIARHWLRAFTSGCPVTFIQLLGMKFRKVNVGEVLTQGISATQAGHPIRWRELESAYLQGVDLQKVVAAYLVFAKRDEKYAFAELVEAERESRLSKMLGR
jgi:uncharacterized protein YqfA (UPF0365 family)